MHAKLVIASMFVSAALIDDRGLTLIHERCAHRSCPTACCAT
jgi:hypothetical protein